MFFEKLFKRKDKTADYKEETSKKVEKSDVTAPRINYVHTNQNTEKTIAKENDVLVLDWIAKKKKGYDRTSNKYPKWFSSGYGIDFEKTLIRYIDQGLLIDEDGVIKISSSGNEKLKEYDYVIYLHDHPQYCLTLNDFKNAKNLHKIQNSDIAWGVFNQRSIEYIKNQMWGSLAANYANMADLLISEGKYEQALDNIFATAYIETSGMRDDNELTEIMTEYTNRGLKKQYLENGMPNIFLLEINNYYVTVPFHKIQDSLNLEWEEVRSRFLNSIQIASLEKLLPFKYFEKKESFEIFRQAIEADGKKGIFRLADCSKKLKWNKPDENSSSYFYASVENKVNRKFKNR